MYRFSNKFTIAFRLKGIFRFEGEKVFMELKLFISDVLCVFRFFFPSVFDLFEYKDCT